VLIFGYTPAQIRKFFVATAGVLGVVLTANLLPEDWAHWVSSVAALLTAFATFKVPNEPLDVPGVHAAPDAT
jgi:hypothetical protein